MCATLQIFTKTFFRLDRLELFSLAKKSTVDKLSFNIELNFYTPQSISVDQKLSFDF